MVAGVWLIWKQHKCIPGYVKDWSKGIEALESAVKAGLERLGKNLAKVRSFLTKPCEPPK
jgi:hypothetical protein